jgi:tetratricopeptide (TPR) repeat protein
MKGARASRWPTVALLGLLAVIPYLQALEFDFVWDDRSLILENEHIQDERLLAEALTADYWQSADEPEAKRSFYRPVVTLSFFVDWFVWGDDASGFHATNLLLHLLNVLLVFSCFSAFGSPGGALVAGALFAVHPVHTESVTWISGRTDLFASLFVLGAFRLYLSLGRRERIGLRVVLVGLLYTLAILSKEVAIVLPVAIGLYALLFHGESQGERRGDKIVLGVMAGIAAAYLAMRLWILEMPVLVEADRSFSLLVFNLPRIIARYLLKLVFPARLYAHDPMQWAFREGWPAVALSFLAVGAVLLIALLAGSRDRRSLFGALWTTVFLLPVLNAGAFTDVLSAERFLYLPSAGFCWALATGYEWMRRSVTTRRWAPLVAGALVAVGGARTFARNPVWTNDLVLFEEIHRTSPGFLLPHRALASVYLRRGRPKDAIEELSHALKIEPRDCGAWNNLSLAYYDLGMSERSAETLDTGFAITRQAMARCPSSDLLYHTLGEYYLAQGKDPGTMELALTSFRNAIALNPQRNQYYFSLGSLLVELGRKEEAKPYLEEYVRMAPSGELRDKALTWLQ